MIVFGLFFGSMLSFMYLITIEIHLMDLVIDCP